MSLVADCALLLFPFAPSFGTGRMPLDGSTVKVTAAEIESALAAAVDLDDPKARRETADELAARKDVSIGDWVRAMESFAPVVEVGDEAGAPREAGSHRVRVPLRVLGAVEETDLFLYLPRRRDLARAAPLLLAFHGTGGSGREMEAMWRETAEAFGMLVLAPSEAGPNAGYAFSPRERAAALAALRWMRRRYDVDENRVYATGISRGGHLAWDLALRYPDLLAAIAPMIGGPRFQLADGQNNLRFLENVVNLPIRDLQGMKDDPGLIANLRLAFDRLAKLKARDARLVEFPDLGHSFDFRSVDWVAFLDAAVRDPTPDRIVRVAARTDEARAFWCEVTKLDAAVVENVVPKVAASTWKSLGEDARRKLLEQEVEKRTARLEVRSTGKGRFSATSDRVAGFRLLLANDQFDADTAVQVVFGARFVEKRVRPDARVLLREFVERFDRRFLPVAALELP